MSLGSSRGWPKGFVSSSQMVNPNGARGHRLQPGPVLAVVAVGASDSADKRSLFFPLFLPLLHVTVPVEKIE